MAMGWFDWLADGRFDAWSGSEPCHEIDAAAVAAMSEVGIEIAQQFPKLWTQEIIQAADVVITMGCRRRLPLVPWRAL